MTESNLIQNNTKRHLLDILPTNKLQGRKMKNIFMSRREIVWKMEFKKTNILEMNFNFYQLSGFGF